MLSKLICIRAKSEINWIDTTHKILVKSNVKLEDKFDCVKLKQSLNEYFMYCINPICL